MNAIQASQEPSDSKLAEFWAEVQEGQEQTAATALKHVQRDKPYNFKHKGNEEQAAVNTRLDEALAEVQAELDEFTSALGHAQESITRGRKAIAERQKLIKIPDCSELGWAVVAEYTADKLADNSDDEKWLEKAEKGHNRESYNPH